MVDLGKVLKATWDARAKWYNIGLELNIDPRALDTIQKNTPDFEDCFRTMLMTWLETVEPGPTSEALADALRSPTVGFEHLAFAL